MDRIPTLRPRLLRTTNRGHTVTTRVLRNAPERASMVTPNTPAGDFACPDVFTASVANGYGDRGRGRYSEKERLLVEDEGNVARGRGADDTHRHTLYFCTHATRNGFR